MIIVVMGVCGSGKTTVGEAVAKTLNVPFRDADEFHSVENKKKMSSGIPLTDEKTEQQLERKTITLEGFEIVDKDHHFLVFCGEFLEEQIIAKSNVVSERYGDEDLNIVLPLEDRYPWLMAIHNYMKELHNEGRSGVVTCSALKKSYRHILLTGSDITTYQNTNSSIESLVFILLTGSKDTILRRMGERKGHFMPASLLESQLATLEVPDNTERCIQVSIENDVDGITDEIIKSTS